jgi:hypothetical protein
VKRERGNQKKIHHVIIVIVLADVRHHSCEARRRI